MLSWRQTWLAVILFWYPSFIEHLKGKKNTADGPLQRPNYKIGYEDMTASRRTTIASTTITESYGDFLPNIMAAQEANFLFT